MAAASWCVPVPRSTWSTAQAWYNDPAYAPLIKRRQSGSDLDLVVVEGV